MDIVTGLDSDTYENEDEKSVVIPTDNCRYNPAVNEPITLNVGGQKYTTTKATLSTIHGTFLYKMLIEGKFVTKPLEDNSFFIDRDGHHFRYILNFLRDGYVNVGDESIITELLQEAMFYQIQPMIKYLNAILNKERIKNIKSSILNRYHTQSLLEKFDKSDWTVIHHEYSNKYSAYEEFERTVQHMNVKDSGYAKMMVFKFADNPSMVFGIFLSPNGSKSFIFQNGKKDRNALTYVELKSFECASYTFTNPYSVQERVKHIKFWTDAGFILNALEGELNEIDEEEGPTDLFALECNKGDLLWCAGHAAQNVSYEKIDEYEIFACF